MIKAYFTLKNYSKDEFASRSIFSCYFSPVYIYKSPHPAETRIGVVRSSEITDMQTELYLLKDK